MSLLRSTRVRPVGEQLREKQLRWDELREFRDRAQLIERQLFSLWDMGGHEPQLTRDSIQADQELEKFSKFYKKHFGCDVEDERPA